MNIEPQPLISLCASLLLEARQLETTLRRSPEIWSEQELAKLLLAPCTILDEGPLSERVVEALDEALHPLERDIDVETQGYTRHFDGFHDPDEGDIGRIVSQRNLTARGRDLEHLQSQYEDLRHQCLSLGAQIAAARHVRQALQGCAGAC